MSGIYVRYDQVYLDRLKGNKASSGSHGGNHITLTFHAHLDLLADRDIIGNQQNGRKLVGQDADLHLALKGLQTFPFLHHQMAGI